MAACIRVGLTIAWFALVSACDDPSGTVDGGPDAAAPTATIVDLGFFGQVYEGATVCVEETCGVLGVDETLRVTPVIRGTSFLVTVTLDEVAFQAERDFSPDVQAIGGDPELAVSRHVSVALIAREMECGVYLTNHTIGDTVVTSVPPALSERETLCGPFAALGE